MKLRSHLSLVNEGYFQHMRHALSFTLGMFLGAVCCLVHAFLPFLFEQTGSKIVARLNDRMVVNRSRLSAVVATDVERTNSVLHRAELN